MILKASAAALALALGLSLAVAGGAFSQPANPPPEGELVRIEDIQIDQRIEILRQFMRQQFAKLTPAEKPKVKAALIELAGEL